MYSLDLLLSAPILASILVLMSDFLGGGNTVMTEYLENNHATVSQTFFSMNLEHCFSPFYIGYRSHYTIIIIKQTRRPKIRISFINFGPFSQNFQMNPFIT